MFNNKRIVSCRCGSLVIVPSNYEVDSASFCDDCDKPLGVKMYEAFA